MGVARINGDAWEERPDGTVALLASRCEDCARYSFPPVPRCPDCLSERLSQTPLAAEGTLYSYTVVHQRRPGLPVPYVVGYVDFPEGLRAFGPLSVAPKQVRIGMRLRPVRLDLQDDGGQPLGVMFGFGAGGEA